MDNAAADCDRCGMYLVRWCIEPIKLLSCLNVLGGDSFSMASAFLVNGVVPSLSMWYTSHSICFHANLHLSFDIARFSSSNFCRTFCNVFL